MSPNTFTATCPALPAGLCSPPMAALQMGLCLGVNQSCHHSWQGSDCCLLGFGVFIPVLLPGEGQSSCRHLQCLLLMLFFILCYISMESSSVFELSPGCGCRNSTHRRGCGFPPHTH